MSVKEGSIEPRIARITRIGANRVRKLKAIKQYALVLCGFIAAGSLSGCPPANGFFIRVQNDAVGIAVTVVRLRDFNGQANVTDSLLRMDVGPGSSRCVFVPLRDVGGADAVKVRVAGTNPQQPIGFAITRVIDGGFEAGKTVTVTVAGSPTQSVSIEVDPS